MYVCMSVCGGGFPVCEWGCKLVTGSFRSESNGEAQRGKERGGDRHREGETDRHRERQLHIDLGDRRVNLEGNRYTWIDRQERQVDIEMDIQTGNIYSNLDFQYVMWRGCMRLKLLIPKKFSS